MLEAFIIGLAIIVAVIVWASFISRPERVSDSRKSNKDADI